MRDNPVVIVAGARTPMGGFLGALKDVPAPDLGAAAIRAVLAQIGVDADGIDETLMGCVLPAGLGQAPARQAALGAGLADATRCTTVNKMCGSGMQAAILGHDMLAAGSADVVVAGGMENMSRAPYLLDRARAGYRMGHGRVVDHMFMDGLEDAYEPSRLMGTFAEDCAEARDFSREDQDAFAIASLERARAAIENGAFADEIVPIEAGKGAKAVTVDTDEQPHKASIERVPQLRPVFRGNGSVTAANASSISDGGAALLLMRRSEAERRGLAPLAMIRGHTAFADKPGLFPTAPIGAMKKLADRTGWEMADVDLFEINEAFAVVAMAAIQAFDLSHEKVNVRGGACALGHPIGASGARIVVTLLSAMREREAKRGVAAICIGGGEATALALERCE